MPLRIAFSIRCDAGTADACNGLPVSVPLNITTRDEAINWAVDNGWRPMVHQQWSCPACSKNRSIRPRRL